MKDREREAGRDTGRHSPDVGLDPQSPASRLGPKAGAKPLSHPGIPHFQLFDYYCRVACVLLAGSLGGEMGF